MTNTPLLTVITVNYNNASGLKRTLESVVPQLSEQVNYVVIDGGSSDESREIIESVSSKLHYWCSEPDGGIYPAMNKGVNYANGRYVIFINSGDELCAEVIQNIIPKLEVGAADIIYGDIRVINPEDGKVFIDKFSDKLTLTDLYENYLPHPGSFIYRDMLVNMPYSEELRIVSDYEFFLKAIIVNGCSTLHVKDIISNFYLDGISKNSVEIHAKERSLILNRYFKPVTLETIKDIKRIEKLDCYPEILRLTETRRLHRRIRPLLKVILFIDKLFHTSKCNDCKK